jgi:hypothetical protein
MLNGISLRFVFILRRWDFKTRTIALTVTLIIPNLGPFS